LLSFFFRVFFLKETLCNWLNFFKKTFIT